MGSVNRTIIASVVIIMATGIYHYFLQGGKKNTTLTRIIVGGYMLGLTASLFDLIGYGIGQVAGYILMLAVGVAIFTVAGDLYTRLQTPGAVSNYSGTPAQQQAAAAGQNVVAGAQAGAPPGSVLKKLPQKVCIQPTTPFDIAGWVSYAICKAQGGSG